ncbi:LVIVD repeat-containing protein [Haloglomus litoreum]|uniref:LVIVD repeat-containing protein n=1 Tax=Haloglomus litoreum TaxID=3034026 RepID=UPI0023E776A7|nr:hypothetical protein [Haloglomus sp. DT116]
MNRRSLLRRGAALPFGLATLGTVSGTGTNGRATQTDYGPLAELGIPKAKEVVPSADGRTAFLAVTDGFAVVDVTDPESPEVVHENREPWAGEGNGRLEQIYDVKLDAENDLLAVVGPANPRNAWKGLIVYDVSDPTAPEKVAVHETEFFNHNCFATGGYVYLCGNASERNSLVVVDARAGEEVGRWSIADVDERWTEVGPNWVLHDVYVHDGVAYLAHWDAGTWAVDVSDPTAPELLARIRGRDAETFVEMTRSEARQDYSEPPGNDHYVATSDDGTLLGISLEAWDTNRGDDSGGPGGVWLYDVSDPTAAEELAFIEPPPTDDPTFGGTWTTSHNFSFAGDRLYTSWYEGGVRVYDVSDPADPALLARWRDSDAASMWTAEPTGRGAFLATSHRDGPRASSESSADGAALYTFPDPPADAEPLTPTPGPTPTVTDTATGSETATGTATTTPTPSATDTPTAAETPTATDAATPDAGATDGEPTGTSAAGPGFGPLAALGGLGLGAWRLLRRPEDDR